MKTKKLQKTLKKLPIGDTITINNTDITRIDKTTYITFTNNNQINEHTLQQIIKEITQ